MALPSNQDRLDVLFPDARHVIRCTPKEFGAAGARLAELFSDSLVRRCRDLTDASLKMMLMHRIDLARLAATLEDYRPDSEMPEASYMDFRCNAPMADRQESARLVVLAILLAADPDSGSVITPSICEFARLAWYDGPGGLLGRGLIDWKEPGWDGGNSPSDRVLDRLRAALQLIRAGSVYPNGWGWSQDGCIFFDGTGVGWEAMLPELLQQAERLAELVHSCDPDENGGRMLGDRKGAFDRAFCKMSLLAGTIIYKLYIPTRRQDNGEGVVLAELIPIVEYQELAEGVSALQLMPFGAFGLEQLQNLSAKQIDRFERNVGLVAKLARSSAFDPVVQGPAVQGPQVTRGGETNPVAAVTPDVARAFLGLRPATRRAGQSYLWVQQQRPELVGEYGTVQEVREAQHEYIKRSGYCPAYEDQIVPKFDAWCRYVRRYQKSVEGPIYGARHPETRSIVRANQLPRGQSLG